MDSCAGLSVQNRHLKASSAPLNARQRGVARAPGDGLAGQRSPEGESASGAERAEAMDGRRERPATGHGRPRSNAGAGTPGGRPVGGSSAGPAKVSSFLGRTSSLLKRSPIPASPACRQEDSPPTLTGDPEATPEPDSPLIRREVVHVDLERDRPHGGGVVLRRAVDPLLPPAGPTAVGVLALEEERPHARAP